MKKDVKLQRALLLLFFSSSVVLPFPFAVKVCFRGILECSIELNTNMRSAVKIG